MVNTNLRSGFFLAREMAADMIGAGLRGRILFMASLHEHTPRNLPHYAASKAGQVMVVKELARALGPAGIRVNAIAPGAIPGDRRRNGVTANRPSGDWDAIQSRPDGRFCTVPPGANRDGRNRSAVTANRPGGGWDGSR